MQFVLDALGPAAGVADELAAAVGTILVQIAGIAAVVAHQPVVGTVVGQSHRAVGALDHLLTTVAAHCRMVAAPVEQQDALLSRLEIVQQLGGQLLADVKAIALGGIDNLHLWQLVPQIPMGQGIQPDAPALCLIEGFHRRSRRCQQQQRLMAVTARTGDVPRMIPRRLLGSIGSLLLLVNHNQPNLFQRRKHRRAGTHHHICQALLDAPVLVGALCHGQSAVQHRHPLTKSAAEQPDRLRREGNFRHQNDDPFALCAHLLCQL